MGLVSAAVILGEQPGASDIVGFCLIGLGILAVGLADRRQAKAMARL